MEFTISNIFAVVILLTINQVKIAQAFPIRGEGVKNAGDTEYSFVVSLGSKSDIGETPDQTHFCTGVLIAKNLVLTADHCLEERSPYYTHVAIGNSDLQKAVLYDVETWVTYNDWADDFCIDTEFDDNDIAILKLTKDVEDPNIQPAQLSQLKNAELYGTDATILGWGVTSGGEKSRHLKAAGVTIMTNKECEERFKLVTGDDIPVHHRVFCSSSNPVALLECGDSGGPIIDENNIILGIHEGYCPMTYSNSFTESSVDQHRMNSHVGLDYYRDFIISVTEDVL